MWKYLLSVLPLFPGVAHITSPLAATVMAEQTKPQTEEVTLLLELLRTQPQDVALTVHQIVPGQPLALPLLEHNAAQPMPLASSMKIVVLATYARAVAAGDLDPEQPITLAEWEQFYVLQDGGAHAAALESLNIPTNFFGRAKEGSQTVPLDTLARAMIQFSDNAATDLIMTRLHRERIAEAVKQLGLDGQEPLAPVAGIFAAWDSPQAQSLLEITPQARADLYWTEAAEVAAQPSRRSPWAIIAGAVASGGALDRQLQNQTFPGGTTADYARLMAAVLGADTGQFSAAELAVMRRHLGWLLEVSPENAAEYSAAYLKGGSLEHGVLTDNYAMVPRRGTHAGEAYAVSLFTRQLSSEQNAALGKELNSLMLQLAFDPQARAAVRDTLNLMDD